jgi:hypothetical protein
MVTVPGRVYSLDFDAGIFGMKTGTLQLRAQVNGNSSLLNQTVTPPYAGTYNPASVRFQHYHYAFTADSDMTALQFTDVGLGNANADIVLDTVSVTSTPTSLVENGGFEAGAAGWTTSGAAGVLSDSFAHSGGFYAFLGNVSDATGGLTTTDDIAVPEGATGLNLGFWLNVTSGKPPGPAVDTLKVVLLTPAPGGGYASIDVAVFTQADRGANQPGNPYYIQHSFNLPGGLRFVKLLFYSDSGPSVGAPTVFRIDDVRLEAALSPSPAP